MNMCLRLSAVFLLLIFMVACSEKNDPNKDEAAVKKNGDGTKPGF